ncbi:MAG: sensor domain-containing diguanylate cyclase [Planctomycetota bacterium]|jgi:diguanylate cyclase (GGDEF)-like protein
MPTITIENVLACPHLPSLPTVAVQVLELTNQENVKIHDIEVVVQNDPALVSKILKTVNSSFYGLSKPCPTIGPAITYLGLNTVKSLVLGFSLVDLSRRTGGEVDLIEYWQRCLCSAAAARRLAGSVSEEDPEEAFIAALMQDIGMLAMEAALGADYGPVLAAAGDDHDRLPELEQQAFGFDHAEAGAQLAERWRLPTQLVAPIRLHHRGRAADEGQALPRIVALAAQMGRALGHGDQAIDLPALTRSAKDLGVDREEVKSVMVGMTNDLRQLSGLFKVNVGQIPDATALLAEAEEARLAHQVRLARETESLQQVNRQLSREATTDGLTQVANRKRFDDELAAGVEQARTCSWPIALILTDVDHFKKFNDTYGHQAGDLVLVELARRYSETVGNAGLVCRYGGEEFAAILPGADRAGATRMAEAMRTALHDRPVDIRAAGSSAEEVQVTASFGVAVFDPPACTVLGEPRLLLLASDKALYAAKHAGRNAVRVFRPRRRPGGA